VVWKSAWRRKGGGGWSGYGCCLLARVAAAYKHVVVDQGASLYGNENLCRKVQR